MKSQDHRRTPWIDDGVRDVRHGVRALLARPGVAALAIVTLALGIGANTAVFSVLYGVLLRPLPYGDGDRLVVLRQSAPLAGQADTGVSIQEYLDYRDQSDAFESLVEYHQMSFDLLSDGGADRVDTGVVSHTFFDVLGITPLYGRSFVEADDEPGAEAVLMLSYPYWQSRFGGRPDVVGRVLEMNDRPHRVIGVLPDVPHYPQANDVYMPVSACPFRAAAARRVHENRRIFSLLTVFGRLHRGISTSQAAASVDTIARRFTRDNPTVYRPATSGFVATTIGVRDALTRGARPMLLILLGTTAIVLLIACANVANLTLARVLQRDRELAMRAALGADRWRLVRQLLAESVLTAGIGSLLGVLLALPAVDMLTRFVGRFTSRTGAIAIDGSVLVFTLVVAGLSGVLVGTLPALATRANLALTLKEGSAQAGTSRGRRRLQGTLIVAQVALAVVLLAGAGLLVASLYRLQRVDAGYRTENVLSAEVYGNFSRYATIDRQRALYRGILERLEHQPGVVAAAVTNAVPLSAASPGNQRFDIEHRVTDDPDRRPVADVRVASPRYFDTLGIPLVAGRRFSALDNETSQRVVIVNEAMQRYWDDASPLDARLSFDRGATWLRVVGIVGNVRQFDIARDAVAQLYVPLAQSSVGLAGEVLVRTAADATAFAPVLREIVRAVDPDQTVENVRTLAADRAQYLATPRLTATLLMLFAGLALVITLAGITGVVATSVTERTREFGLRMALGASRSGLLRLVILQGLGLVGLGLAVGLVGAAALGRVLDAYLYDTVVTDPLILTAVALVFLTAGAVACLGPARRATTVDPLIALKAD